MISCNLGKDELDTANSGQYRGRDEVFHRGQHEVNLNKLDVFLLIVSQEIQSLMHSHPNVKDYMDSSYSPTSVMRLRAF